MPSKEACGKYSLFDYEKLEKKSVITLQYFTSHLAQTSDFKENETQRFFSRLHWSVQSLNCVRLFATPWTAAHQASLSITNSWSLLKFMSIESVMLSNRLILCCPFLLLPSISPSIRVSSNESALCIRWLEFQLQHQSFQ